MTDDQINGKIARYLFSLKGLDYDAEVAELQSVYDDSYVTGSGGGCDTCGYGGGGDLELDMVVSYQPTHGRSFTARLHVPVSYADCLLYLLKDTPNAY